MIDDVIGIIRSLFAPKFRKVNQRIDGQAAQLAQIADDVAAAELAIAGLENSGVDTVARAGLEEITSTLTVANATWGV